MARFTCVPFSKFKKNIYETDIETQFCYQFHLNFENEKQNLNEKKKELKLNLPLFKKFN